MYISFFHVLRITVAYSLYNTQNAHHYCNNHRHLLPPSSQTHHGHFEASMTLQTMHHCKSLGFWSYQEYFSNPMGPPSLLHYTFIVKNKLGHSHVALLGFLESKSNREQISVVRYVLLLCASAASWSGRGQILMSMTQCVLFRLISHESWDHRGSLVSSLEQVHTKARSIDTLKSPIRICIGTELKWWHHWFLKIIHETLFSTLYWLYVLHWYLR